MTYHHPVCYHCLVDALRRQRTGFKGFKVRDLFCTIDSSAPTVTGRHCSYADRADDALTCMIMLAGQRVIAMPDRHVLGYID